MSETVEGLSVTEHLTNRHRPRSAKLSKITHYGGLQNKMKFKKKRVKKSNRLIILRKVEYVLFYMY